MFIRMFIHYLNFT